MTAASRLIIALYGLAVATAFAAAPAAAQTVGDPAGHKSHGIAIHGDLKYPSGFEHFDYVNPNAPKGGTARLAWFGTFDNLNPFILRGVAAIGTDLLYDTLLTTAFDEPNSEYGLVAESVEVPDDRSWVIFNLRPEARFSDGSPITADDVVFSFNILLTKGHPRRRFYYASVEKVEKLGERRVKFTFKPGDNRELPVILGSLPVLSKAYWEKRDFERAILDQPLSSGPYKVDSLEPGRTITYRRDPDYWAKDLPVNVGRFNFDRIRYDFYRDATVAFEAFKAGAFDFQEEYVAKNWAVAYDFPAVREGLVLRETPPGPPKPPGMQGYFFNTRHAIFADPKVREAISYAFDFEWTNRQLFYGLYQRTESYFSDTELAARGLPQGGELALLERFRGQLPERVFTEPYKAPSSDGPGGIRANLLAALKLLKEAGWEVNAEGRLVNVQTGAPMRFEILLNQPSLERLTGPFIANLHRLGIDATMRTVDTSQYQNRMDAFDFDMTPKIVPQSMSPGNEQREFFSSQASDTKGSFNVAGVRDPVVDALIELLIASPDRATLVTRSRALDRVLLAGFYVIPHYHFNGNRIAYWNKFGHPATTPLQGFQFDTWWIDNAKDSAVASGKDAATAKLQAEQAAQKGGAGGVPGWLPVGGAALLLIAALAWRRRRGKG